MMPRERDVEWRILDGCLVLVKEILIRKERTADSLRDLGLTAVSFLIDFFPRLIAWERDVES